MTISRVLCLFGLHEWRRWKPEDSVLDGRFCLRCDVLETHRFAETLDRVVTGAIWFMVKVALRMIDLASWIGRLGRR